MSGRKPSVIAITGASSGLGAALAAHYAAPGVTLHLHGRHTDRLHKVAEACREKQAFVTTATADVRDREAMRQWLDKADDHQPVDLLIANAGVSGGTAAGMEEDAQVYHLWEVNLNGVLHTVQPMLPRMRHRKSGQIALVSSLAGLRGMPSAPAYSASKNAVRAYGEALRPLLKKDGVAVMVVCPGFIRTPLTDVNSFPMPLLMEAADAAALIAAKLEKNPARIAFPLAMYWPMRLLTCLPQAAGDWITGLMPGK